MAQYETTIIVTPVLTDQELKKTISGYVEFLKSNGAEIVEELSWGLRQLAYPIKKKSTGFYFTVEYKCSGELLDTLELSFRRDESILRFLSVKLDKFHADYNERKRQGLVGPNRKNKETKVEEEA